MNKIYFHLIRQGENTYFLHFTDEEMEVESYGSNVIWSNVTPEPSLLVRARGTSLLHPELWKAGLWSFTNSIPS